MLGIPPSSAQLQPRISRRHLLLGLAGSGLSACAQGGLYSVAPVSPGASVQPIWVVASDASVKVPAARGTTAGIEPLSLFERFNISIPANHVVGQVEWPGRQFDPQNDFFVSGQDSLGNMDRLMDDVARNVAPDQEIGVFIHGYNTTYPEAVYRHAQIAHDFKLSGPQITFVWPSEGTPLTYLADRDSVLVAREALHLFLDRLCKRFPNRVTLAAHSMGAFLAMETLQQSAIKGNPIADRLAGLVLISPDIGMRVFESQVKSVTVLPDQTMIFVSQKDRLLRLSQRLAGGKLRLGEGRDIEVLKSLNIVVIDLSEIQDGDPTGHTTALSSPIAISMLRALITNEDALTEQAGSGSLFLPISTVP